MKFKNNNNNLINISDRHCGNTFMQNGTQFCGSFWSVLHKFKIYQTQYWGLRGWCILVLWDRIQSQLCHYQALLGFSPETSNQIAQPRKLQESKKQNSKCRFVEAIAVLVRYVEVSWETTVIFANMRVCVTNENFN